MFMFQMHKALMNAGSDVQDRRTVWSRFRLTSLQLLVAVLIAGFAAGAFAEPATVNINAADATVIAEVLDGVGMSRAEAIVEYRRQHGAFADAYDLANVKGIGDRTVELNEDRIRLQD
jgi:competence protein ComEA